MANKKMKMKGKNHTSQDTKQKRYKPSVITTCVKETNDKENGLCITKSFVIG